MKRTLSDWPMKLLLILLVVAGYPVQVPATISEKLRELQVDENAKIPELYELYQQEATTPSAAAAIYQLILREVPEPMQRGRGTVLRVAIRSTLQDHAALLAFQAGLPEETRPFRSMLIAGHLAEHSEEVSEAEFWELEEILIQDLDNFVGQIEVIPLVEAISAVSRKYRRLLGYTSEDPDATFAVVSDCLCRVSSKREYDCVSSVLLDQRHPESRRFFLEELTGQGCTGSDERIMSRPLLEQLLRGDSGAEDLVSVLHEPRNERTYAMALLVASFKEDLYEHMDLHRTVFDSFEQRFGELDERGILQLDAHVHMTFYVTDVWPHLKDVISSRPRFFERHAALIARSATKTQILDFAADHGRQWEEPYLSEFVNIVLTKGGSKEELAAMLEQVGPERLPADLLRRAESRATLNRSR